MRATAPSHFYPELSDDRLRAIAVALLDLRYLTFGEMQSPYDDNYTRESAAFGRCKNMLIQMALDRRFDWLTLAHAGMDVTFNIGCVPCRFFRDDPEAPEKPGFFRRNASDMLFDIDEKAPVMWRFIIEKAMTDEDEDRVHFVGYNVFQDKIAEWMYRPSTPMLHSVDRDVPAVAIIPPAIVELREDQQADSDQNNNDSRKTGNAS